MLDNFVFPKTNKTISEINRDMKDTEKTIDENHFTIGCLLREKTIKELEIQVENFQQLHQKANKAKEMAIMICINKTLRSMILTENTCIALCVALAAIFYAANRATALLWHTRLVLV